jgi:hypothetical protein
MTRSGMNASLDLLISQMRYLLAARDGAALLFVNNFLIDFCGISLHILATNFACPLLVREQ